MRDETTLASSQIQFPTMLASALRTASRPTLRVVSNGEFKHDPQLLSEGWESSFLPIVIEYIQKPEHRMITTDAHGT